MSRVSKIEIPITTNAQGGGTVTTTEPVRGEVIEVRMPNAGTALTTGGSADFTLTRVRDGGTVVALTNQAAPFTIQPRPQAHTVTGGTTAYATGVGPVVDAGAGVPVDDYLQLVVLQGALSQSGTVFIHVRE